MSVLAALKASIILPQTSASEAESQLQWVSVIGSEALTNGAGKVAAAVATNADLPASFANCLRDILRVLDIDVLPLDIGAVAFGTAPLPAMDRVKPFGYKGPLWRFSSRRSSAPRASAGLMFQDTNLIIPRSAPCRAWPGPAALA